MPSERHALRAIVAVILAAPLFLAACKDTLLVPEPDDGPRRPLDAAIDTVLARQIDGYLQTLPDGEAGISVLVRYDDEIVYYGSRGLQSKHSGRRLSERSLFRLASVSKPFTAVAVMQLVEKGEIGLDDSILKYFPEFDASWAPITIHMLLSHRSGTYDFLNDFAGSSWRQGITNKRVIDRFAEDPRLKFAPGTRPGYSNSNYVLLAEIISRVKGRPFADYMEETIFEPLGMTESYFRDAETPLSEDETLNYADRDTYLGLRTYTVGPMGMVSSTYEIDLFMRALSRGELLGEASLERMLVPYSNLFGASYGYGFMFGADWYGHGGSLDGAQTSITFYPRRNVHLIALSNGGSRTYDYIRRVASIVEAYY